ncbi:hypothetical protein EVAR_40283_1 [Eumeta japonica]|uniref:Uncharacterized protein n=1 Tax=Eumeta variegata TaxID=151549 RepID=A0A4C1WX88_EUMVA|nr:hypothetical protein EVAR_40283_1 [Eumeta japonica]
MRAQIIGDEKVQEFSEKLLQIGKDTYPIVENTGYNVIETPEQLINEVYPSIAEWLRERIILATKNDIVNGINMKIIQEMILREDKIYMPMTDEQESINFPTEFLNSLNVQGMPLHYLK